jgi:hypothetical protein
MSISFNWFKSKKVQELQDLQIEEQRIKNDLLRKDLFKTPFPETISVNIVSSEPKVEPKEDLDNKPYLNVKLVNDVLTIVLKDGSIITKPGATADDFKRARACFTENMLIDLVATQEVVQERKEREDEVKRFKAIHKGFELLSKFSHFRVEGNSVYLSGINRSLPQLLIERFIEIVDSYEQYSVQQTEELLLQNDEFVGLKRFFMWACLNPRVEVANSLFDFLSKNGMKITKQGFFVALRNVVTSHGSAELVHFISNAYNKVKAVWKKSPADYHVFLENGAYKMVHTDSLTYTMIEDCDRCDGSGTTTEYDEEYDDHGHCYECDGKGDVEVTYHKDNGQLIGNLTELYLDLPNRSENRFTDNWTRTFDIRIGQVVSMPSENCDWSTQDCATAGLHFAGHTAPYVLCGETTVFTLHNPMKVVGIGTEKGRCWEYLPFMTTNVTEANEIMNDKDFDFLQLDEAYAIRELENLAEKAKEGFQTETSKHDFNLPSISVNEINNIVKSLDEMKSEISSRVSNID